MIRLLKLGLCLFAITYLACTQPAAAQSSSAYEGIVAVVNDDIVTVSEVQDRLQLTLASASLPNTPENRQRMGQQALRGLIDDMLKIQEAARFNISINDEELESAFARIASQNNMTIDEFRSVLSERNVPISAMQEQMRANLAWNHYIERNLARQLTVTETEIDDKISQINANAGKPEYQVADILLPVASPANEEEIRLLASRLIEELNNGAPFGAIAQQFSAAAGANQGGMIGWVTEGQLEPEIDDALSRLQPRQFAGPIRSISGYHIIMLNNMRITGGDAARSLVTTNNNTNRNNSGNGLEVELSQLVFPLLASAPPPVVNARMTAAQNLRDGLEGCDALNSIASSSQMPSSGPVGRLPVSTLPSEIGMVVSRLDIGEPSEVIRTPAGLVILMVCARYEPETIESPEETPEETTEETTEDTTEPTTQENTLDIDRDEIRALLMEEQMDMLQRRALRDIRSAAFIEIR